MVQRVIAALVAALVGLAVAAAGAQARTIVVDQRGTGDVTTIAAALAAAGPGDVVDVRAGRYDEHPEISIPDLTLQGAPGTMVTGTASPGIAVRAPRVRLRGLLVAGAAEGIGVVGPGAGATIEDVSVLADTTAVRVDGADATIVRSLLAGTATAAEALVVRNALPGAQHVTLDSTVLAGGRAGTGLHVVAAPFGGSAGGPVDVALVHATVASAPTAVRTERAAGGGTLAVAASRSILHGAAPGVALDRTETTAADAATFRDAPGRDFGLRADAPGIDQGGPVGPGESATDLTGAPRVSGAASDLGATEFVNAPPTAALVAGTDTVAQNRPVAFDAGGSADPDLGGRIVYYEWDFGDGTTAVTATPVIEHAYAQVGQFAATVRVADTIGATATSAPAVVGVSDGVLPTLSITTPRDRAKLHRLRTVRRNGRKVKIANVLRFSGRATDAGGVARVELTLRRAGLRPAPSCQWLDVPGRRVVLRPCLEPPIIHAAYAGGAWSWRTPTGLKVPAGSWELKLIATDRIGNLSTTMLHFTVT